MKTIILAAGMGVSLDGANRLSLTISSDGETVFERLRNQFSDDLTIVVGYRAADVISSTYSAKHVLNPFWHETGSAYSAFLGLEAVDPVNASDKICIIPSDLIFSEQAVEQVKQSNTPAVFGLRTEFRSPESANLELNGNVISAVYSGHIKNVNDPMFRGPIIFNGELLTQIKEVCRNNSELSLVEAIIACEVDFNFGELSELDVFEINSVNDYLSAKAAL